MSIEVPMRSTPITKEQAFAALNAAWGPGLTRELARGLLSLVWIETARGGSTKNNNPGNISASPNYSGMIWRPTWFAEPTEETSARDRMLHAQMLANKAPSAFRAYATLSDGFADFVRQLRRTFPEVIEAAQSGTPDSFRVALSQKYSQDYRNPAATATFESFWKLFDPVVSLLPMGVALSTVPLALPGSESSGPQSICSGEASSQSPTAEAGFLRNEKYSVPGIQDEPKKQS